MARPRINLIGAGKLARTLARLWRDRLGVAAVVTRSLASATDAVTFIGAGEAATLTHPATLPAADYWLLATPDDTLDSVVHTLATAIPDWHDTIVFHGSGATSSQRLAPLARAGARTASAHPVHSFAHPEHSLSTFQNTWCLIEGDPTASQALAVLFTAIGARPFISDRCDKALYHSATAMASNLLVALLYQAENVLCDATGLSPAEARNILAPLSRHTLENHCRDGAEAALTGPVSRGDVETVARHIEALAGRHIDALDAYRSLSRTAVDIATRQTRTAVPPLQRIRELLNDRS